MGTTAGLVFAAYLNVILGLIFINSPIVVAFLYIFFRATFGAAAWTKVTVLGLPYSLPAVGLVTFAAIYTLARQGVVGRLNPVFKIFILFVYVAAFASIVDLETGVATAEFSIKILCPAMIYILVYYGIRKENDIDHALRLLLYTSIPNIFVSVWEYATGNILAFDPDELEMTSVSSDRIAGTIIDANNYGIYSAFLLFATLPFFLKRKSKESMLFMLGLAFCLFLSQNRGTWIALFVSFIVTVAVFHKHIRVLYWLGTAGIITVLSLPLVLKRFSELHQVDEWGQSQDTFSGRLAYHVELLYRSFEHPWFGTGQGTALWSEISPGVIDDTWPHNDYLRILVDSGYIAAIMYIVFLAAQLIRSWKLRHCFRWDLQFAAFSTQMYIIIISLMQNLYLDLLVYPTFMYLLAVFHKATAFDKIAQDAAHGTLPASERRNSIRPRRKVLLPLRNTGSNASWPANRPLSETAAGMTDLQAPESD